MSFMKDRFAAWRGCSARSARRSSQRRNWVGDAISAIASLEAQGKAVSKGFLKKVKRRMARSS